MFLPFSTKEFWPNLNSTKGGGGVQLCVGVGGYNYVSGGGGYNYVLVAAGPLLCVGRGGVKMLTPNLSETSKNLTFLKPKLNNLQFLVFWKIINDFQLQFQHTSFIL